MPTKTLRIMIADTQQSHRMKLEFLFNLLGYFRIAPVSDMHELLTLVEYGSEPFDLVLVNDSLADETLALPEFFLDNAQVRHAMIYNAPPADPLSRPVTRLPGLQLNRAPLPDLVSLQRLMDQVELAFSETAQPWGRSLRHSLGG